MKAVEIGSRVRLAPRIWGTVQILDSTNAFIHWVKVRRVTEKSYRMWFPVLQIVPDPYPLASTIPWRLRYWIQDGHGAGMPGLTSTTEPVEGNENPSYTPLPETRIEDKATGILRDIHTQIQCCESFSDEVSRVTEAAWAENKRLHPPRRL